MWVIKKILRTTDPKLRQISKPVTQVDKKLLDLIRDLEETLKAQNDPEGLGLSAPQIGEFRRLFIILHPKTKKTEVFINPEIVEMNSKSRPEDDQPLAKTDGEDSSLVTHRSSPQFMEGCLSLPHYYGPVQRATSVTVKFQSTRQIENDTWKMENHLKTFSGFPAQIIQHEIDHLNGIVFVDRLLQQKRKLYQLKNKEWIEIKLV